MPGIKGRRGLGAGSGYKWRDSKGQRFLQEMACGLERPVSSRSDEGEIFP
ncbi:MAG: hypothetical protein ACUVS3_09075 [Thermodesulfobacteriota bacterium]